MEKMCITGIGLITTLTQSVQQYSALILKGQRFYQPARLLRDPHARECPLALIDLDRMKIPEDKNLRKMGRSSVFALAAVRDCLAQVELSPSELAEVGLIVATQSGELNQIEDYFLSFLNQEPGQASPFLFPGTVLNATAGFLSIHFGLKAFIHTFSGRELSGFDVLDYAFSLLALGEMEQILVVGTDELSPALLKGYADIGVLSGSDLRNPTSGLVPAEGACALLLESPSSARTRGARVIAEIDLLTQLPEALPDSCDTLIAGDNGYGPHDIWELDLRQRLCCERVFPFKLWTGEYFAPSACFAMALASQLASQTILTAGFDLRGKFYGARVLTR